MTFPHVLLALAGIALVALQFAARAARIGGLALNQIGDQVLAFVRGTTAPSG